VGIAGRKNAVWHFLHFCENSGAHLNANQIARRRECNTQLKRTGAGGKPKAEIRLTSVHYLTVRGSQHGQPEWRPARGTETYNIQTASNPASQTRRGFFSCWLRAPAPVVPAKAGTR